jgi:hypothetical protein
MTTPSFVRRWLTRFDSAQVRRLRRQLEDAREHIGKLDNRLAELQTASEGADKALREATGGAAFDPARPFGSLPAQGGVE